ncbi:MAG: DegT/DnrJ/EryC1/StrS family aminotransferase [Bryobacteraceae bacterium]
MKRRHFVRATAAASLAAHAPAAPKDTLAMLGGTPVRKAGWASWPRWDQTEEAALTGVLRSGRWNRAVQVEKFEASYARLLGVPHVLATANGTSALFTALHALGVQPGDEVIVPPYTFVATVNVVLLHYALPVFADTDMDSFQIDPARVGAQISDRTSAIVPVHMAGGAADLDAILGVAKQRGVGVIEDACQAHMGEWRGRKLGAWGDAGCFSFQASKNLNSGEGGAVATADRNLYDRCHAFHNNGRAPRTASYDFQYLQSGANLRLTEFQGALLNAQMTRLEQQSAARHENALYLTKLLEQIPGIRPVRNYAGCTRSAWHLFMFRYDKQQFAGVDRAVFLKALAAEGIKASAGYTPLNKQPFLESMLASKAYRRLFPEKTLAEWKERTQCPVNDRLCEEAVWFTQTMLLGARSDMDEIAAAIGKIQRSAPALRQARV